MISIREPARQTLKLTIGQGGESVQLHCGGRQRNRGPGCTDSQGNNRYVTGVNADGGGLARDDNVRRT